MNRIVILVSMFLNAVVTQGQVIPASSADPQSEQKLFNKRWWLEQIESPQTIHKDISFGFSAIDAQQAEIHVLDNKGRSVSTYRKLPPRGNVQIASGSLKPGDYYYILVVNSRMIVKRKFTIVANQSTVSSTD